MSARPAGEPRAIDTAWKVTASLGDNRRMHETDMPSPEMREDFDAL